MTITYPNGAVLHAIVLTREEQRIRAIAPGHDDVLAFTSIRGTWITEDLEPVTIESDWQRREPPTVPAPDECICPKDLAARLIRTLFAGCEPPADTVPAFNPGGNCVSTDRAELPPSSL